MTRVVLK